MGKDFDSLLHQFQLDGQFTNAKSLKLPFHSGISNTSIPCSDAVPMNCALPAFGSSGLPKFKSGQLKDPNGLFQSRGVEEYPERRLPHFRPCSIPNTMLHDKLVPVTVSENYGESNTLKSSGGHASKLFLVFDHSGNKMTMIYSSGMGSWSPKPTGYYNVSGAELGNRNNEGNFYSGHNLIDKLDEDHGTTEGSEMHEDTEEINALLYSDDEDHCSEDDEETSTGHSPNTMNAYEEEDIDEVASSLGPVKRRKLPESGYEVRSVTNTASASKSNRLVESEDDAQSSCAGGKPMGCGVMGSLLGNKRLRKEKIRETVKILETIIPGGKGKDAIMVLDEAVKYLRTLRFKAKSLGLSAL